jgi:dCTP deaminase
VAFWGNEKWGVANKQREIVSSFSEALLSDGAYKLAIGNEAIVSSGHAEQAGSYKSLTENTLLPLEPGQFAHLIKGLVNISGFHVDPGYHGKLIFTVFNASPSTINLHEGQPIFRLWLSDFEGVGGQSKTSYDRLPRELADRLHGTYPSPFALAARVNQLATSLNELKSHRNQLVLFVFLAVISFCRL